MFKKEVKIPAEIRYTYTLAQPVAISYQPSPLQPGPDRPVLARSVTPLKYPSTYISAKNPKNRLDLNPGNSFSLLEDGQTSSGAFALNANTLELNFSTGIKTQLTIQDGRVTAPDGQSWALREESPAPAPQTVTPVAPLQYPATYVSAKNPKDELQLNADNSFSLQEDGQTYRGPFALDGNVLQLNISPDTNTPMIIQAGRLTAPDGQTWALREQTLAAAPVERNEEIVKNADVIEMSKARLEDATIIAKIRSSRCQFDTSTKALIQMRQSGVSAAVVNAVMTASK